MPSCPRDKPEDSSPATITDFLDMKSRLRAMSAELVKLMGEDSVDLERCKDLVRKLKVELVKMPEMQPGRELNDSVVDILLITRQTYEKAAGLSILCEDIAGFYRNVALLKDYYFDYADVLPRSSSQNLVIGLHLLLLLAENRIAEFHTELELVPEDLRSDAFIAFPITMEQYLTEGSYAKLSAAKERIPEKSFAFFMELLMQTVRDEVAKSCESAYDELPLDEAGRILDLESSEELASYCEKRGWRVADGSIRFQQAEKVENTESIEESVFEIIRRSLHYAVEIERIV